MAYGAGLLTMTVDASTLNDMDTSPVSERIEYLGKCAGSLRRLDKAAGLPPGHAHALTGRIADPHLSTLHKIADGAGVPRAWLTNGDGETPDPEMVRAAVARVCDEAEGRDSSTPPRAA